MEEEDPRATGAGMSALWQRVRRNAGLVLGGRVFAAVLNLAAAAIGVRALGMEAFGMVVLLQAFTRLLAGILSFESWAAVARFGAGPLIEDRKPDLRRLIGLTLRLDLIAFALTWAMAWLLAPLAGRYLGWSDDIIAIAPIYAVSALFITHATPTGFLRLIDRFRPLVVQNAMNAILRLLGAVLVLWMQLGALALAGVWAMAGILSGGWLFLIAFNEARRHQLLPRLRGSWAELASGYHGITRFMISTNATGLVTTLVGHGTTVAVGFGLGPAAASLLALVRQITEAIKKLGSLLGPVILPEIARLEAGGHRRDAVSLLSKTLVWGLASAVVVAALLAVTGEGLLVLVFGEEARPGTRLLVLAGAAAALHTAAFALVPFLLSVGRDHAVILTALLALCVYVPTLAWLMPAAGLLGVGIALVVHEVALQGTRITASRRGLSKAP